MEKIPPGSNEAGLSLRSPVRLEQKNAAARAELLPCPDCSERLQTGWRMAESAANCSPRENSLINGKIQGISSICWQSGRLDGRKIHTVAALFLQIPWRSEQGILIAYQGI
jgi:hypothetical protein